MMSCHEYTHKDIKNPFELYEPDADDSIIDTNISNTSEQDKETTGKEMDFRLPVPGTWPAWGIRQENDNGTTV